MTADLTGYAGKARVRLRTGIGPDDLRQKVLDLMTTITLDCVREGAWRIGHVKCLVEDPREGFLSCSVTQENGSARCHGDMSVPTDRFNIIMNVLLYGLADESVERIVLDDLDAAFGEAAELTVENLIEEHEGQERVCRPCRRRKPEEAR